MFPSSSNCDPFTFTNQTMPGSSFAENENPSSSQDHLPAPFLHFSEPYLAGDNELLINHFLSQQQILCSSSDLAAETEVKMESPMKATRHTTRKKKSGSSEINVGKQAIPRKRSVKKDRHSKIYTAQGPRDRRMRLSLQIARKFFDLQDMLGFDKASKTIEWLFSKSKAAIKELTESLPGSKHSCSGGGKSLSSTSESEVVSGMKKTEDSGGALAIGESLVGAPMEAKNRKSGKAIINSAARESRDKARARARERTIEKKKIRGLEKSKQCSEETNPNNLEPLGSPSPLQTAENFGSCSQEMNSSLKVVAEEEEPGTVHLQEHGMDSVSIIEKFLGITPGPGSSSTFSYSHNIVESNARNSHQNNAVFTGNWDNHNNDTVQYTYCAMTNMKGTTGHLQEQNPSAIYMINLDDQEKKSSSTFMTTANAYKQSPSSVFMAARSANEQNPSSILMTTSNIDSQSHLLENQFSCQHTAGNEYCRCIEVDKIFSDCDQGMHLAIKKRASREYNASQDQEPFMDLMPQFHVG